MFSMNQISDHLNQNTFIEASANGVSLSVQYDSDTDYEKDVEPVLRTALGKSFKTKSVSGLLFFADYTFKGGVQEAVILND